MKKLRSFERTMSIQEIKESDIYEHFKKVNNDDESLISHAVVKVVEVEPNRCKLGFSIFYKEGMSLADVFSSHADIITGEKK